MYVIYTKRLKRIIMRFIFTKFKYIYMYKWQNFCFFEYFWNAHRKIYIVSSKRISPIANECKVRFAFANPLNFACQQPLPKPDILPRSTEQGRFQEGGCICQKKVWQYLKLLLLRRVKCLFEITISDQFWASQKFFKIRHL